jgi:hypothetical protein
MEDEKEHFEKELELTKSLLAETSDEKKRLEVETEQLKTLLKREVAHFDSEMVSSIYSRENPTEEQTAMQENNSLKLTQISN